MNKKLKKTKNKNMKKGKKQHEKQIKNMKTLIKTKQVKTWKEEP